MAIAPQDAVRATSHCANGVVVPNPSSNPELVADCEVLLSARDTLAGTATLNWSENTAITEWEGITLDNALTWVDAIDLASQNLSGTIPSELGDLTNLTGLHLFVNQLSGPIPPELGDLSNLTYLYLYGNQLIPPLSVNATSLIEVEFDYPENGVAAVANLSATGLQGGSITWELSGDDADDFSVGSGGVLTFDQTPDYEFPTDGDTDNEYVAPVSVSDGSASNQFAVHVHVTDAPDVTLSADPIAVGEGDGAATITVTATMEGDPASDDTDVTLSLSGSLSFLAGSAPGTQGSFSIPITDDVLSEAAETFSVSLGTITSDIADRVSVENSPATVTIAESDPITVTLSGPASVDEGDEQGNTAEYTVTLSGSPPAALTVDYATSDVTATSNADYTAEAGTLTFAADATELTQTIDVETIEDTVYEADESFRFALTGASGGGATPILASPSSITTTIANDDNPPCANGTAVPKSLQQPRARRRLRNAAGPQGHSRRNGDAGLEREQGDNRMGGDHRRGHAAAGDAGGAGRQ